MRCEHGGNGARHRGELSCIFSVNLKLFQHKLEKKRGRQPPNSLIKQVKQLTMPDGGEDRRRGRGGALCASAHTSCRASQHLGSSSNPAHPAAPHSSPAGALRMGASDPWKLVRRADSQALPHTNWEQTKQNRNRNKNQNKTPHLWAGRAFSQALPVILTELTSEPD